MATLHLVDGVEIAMPLSTPSSVLFYMPTKLLINRIYFPYIEWEIPIAIHLFPSDLLMTQVTYSIKAVIIFVSPIWLHIIFSVGKENRFDLIPTRNL